MISHHMPCSGLDYSALLPLPTAPRWAYSRSLLGLLCPSCLFFGHSLHQTAEVARCGACREQGILCAAQSWPPAGPTGLRRAQHVAIRACYGSLSAVMPLLVLRGPLPLLLRRLDRPCLPATDRAKPQPRLAAATSSPGMQVHPEGRAAIHAIGLRVMQPC